MTALICTRNWKRPCPALHQGVLLKIADASPRTREELLAIPGFSQGKMEKYGEEILSVIEEVNPA